MEALSSGVTVSEQAAAFFSGLAYDDIPAAVLARTKLLILDALGTAIAAVPTVWGQESIGMAADLAGPADSTVLGAEHRVGAASAALANGCLAHALDFDDTYFGAIVHPSCCVVPASLAVAEARHASGQAMIVGAVAGYEFLLRVARAGQDNLFRDNYHTTGLLGPMGSAVASARLMDQDMMQMASTMGIAAGLGSGVLQSMREGQHVKALQAGYAAHGGVIAAKLAARQVKGPRRIFEGDLGFYRTYLGDGRYDLDAITEGLGNVWHTPDIAIKMYPGAHRHHFFVESVLKLKEMHRFDPDDVDEICCFPSAQHQHYNFTPVGYRPPNSHVARFSVPFLVAAALVEGQISVQTFSQQSIADQRILALAAKITYKVKEDAEQPARRGHVLIRLRNGQILENIQSYIRGLPENPASEGDLSTKFRMNAEPVVGSDQSAAILNAVLNLEAVPDVCSVLSGIRWA